MVENAQQESHVSGSMVLGLFSYIKWKYGSDRALNVAKNLGERDRGFFIEQDSSTGESKRKEISKAGQYPYGVYANILEEIVKETMGGDATRCMQIGYHGAERAFSKGGYLAYLATDKQKGNPNVLYASEWVWDFMFHKGNMKGIREASGIAQMTLMGFDELTEPVFYLVIGWVEKATHIVSGYSIKIEEARYKPEPGIDMSFKIVAEELLG